MKFRYSSSLLAFFISLASCSKPEVNKPTDVYVVGRDFNHEIASIWKNGVRTLLETDDQHPSYANSVFVKGSDVYVAGTNLQQGVAGLYLQLGVVWKNGVSSILADDHGYALQANAITVDGSDNVYVAGGSESDIGFVAGYWKNKTFVPLPAAPGRARVNSIVVSGTDVYLGGYELNSLDQWVAKYWKNGVATALTDGSHSATVYSMVVSGSDVYAVGYEIGENSWQVAKVWKNGVATSLSDGSIFAEAKAIAVVNGDVHIVGYNGMAAVYWKNGVSAVLGFGQANAIAVKGNDVYIAGITDDFTSSRAVVWKNRTPTYLNNPAPTDVYSIFVN